MNIFLELAKQGFEFYIKPSENKMIKIWIVGKNVQGKLCEVSAKITHELLSDDKAVNAFIDNMIDKLKKTES